jgi:HAD superfamily hydrolase (TIGR01459 family)
MPIPQYQNLSQFINKYNTLFIDLWGVIHDGIIAYPGVNEALLSLKNAQKKIIFISNAPRRASKAVEGLRKVGVPDHLYDGVITSGEVVFNNLCNFFPSPEGKKYIILGPERDAGLLDGTTYTRVENINDADFMIVTGFDNDDSTMAEKQPYLDIAIKLNLPLICANPDLIIVRQSGKQALCAGAIAKKYQEMGGEIIMFGKPYKDVYNGAMQLAGNPAKEKIAAIGDSLLTDIKGANDFAIDSYLIPGGIHGTELGIQHGKMLNAEKLQYLCNIYGIIPTGILPEFVFE